MKNISNKLLSFTSKKINIFDLDTPGSITDKETNLLFKYLDKSLNRIELLKVLNSFRAKRFYLLPKRE